MADAVTARWAAMVRRSINRQDDINEMFLESFSFKRALSEIEAYNHVIFANRFGADAPETIRIYLEKLSKQERSRIIKLVMSNYDKSLKAMA